MKYLGRTIILILTLMLVAVMAYAAIIVSSPRMMETIKYLASDELKGRGLGTPELDRAAEYIARRLEEEGLLPGGDRNGWFQEWTDPELKLRMRNVVGILPGKRPELTGQSVVVGAHYDHLGMFGDRKKMLHQIHPGADDNASGVAVLLELAHTLVRQFDPDRSIVFIAFTGEEAGKRGSKYYVLNEKRYPVSKCIAMLNLDTVGRLGKKKLLALGAGSAHEWPQVLKGAASVAGVELELVPEELDSSDQKSFQEAGVPAVQLFSGPHLDYHQPTDTADKIDPDGLVKVAAVAKEAIEYLANREKPLIGAGKREEKPEPGLKQERKVSLGTIPDFAYKGEGVRLSGVVPGSPAEAVGMKAGDVIVRVNQIVVKGLKDLSDVLKTLTAGNKATVLFVREGKEMKVEAEVRER